MRRSPALPLCSATLLSALIVSSALGQAVTGSITGAVTDADGASIAGARVVARDLDTGVDTPTVTNRDGAYNIRFLPIGNYEVRVTAPGFAAQQFPAFSLEIDKTAKVDAKLKVGAATTTTVVTSANSQILNTSNASLGITMTSKEIEKIPLNGQNFSSVTLFQPGAVNTDPSGMTGGNAIERDTSNNDIASTNGNRNQDNNYLVEGIPMNQIYNNLIGYNPAPDAIQEVKVVSANAPAQDGDANGGDTLVELKSGTSHFHGSAFENLENQNLDANSWGNKHQTPVIARNPFTQSIFGGTLGGPVLRKKLFFFGDYQGVREHSGGTGSASVLTAAMRQGDFSALLHPAPGAASATPVQLYDTQNNFAPYVNNQVPINNPVAQYLFAHPSFYPLPNAQPIDGIVENNLQGPTKSYIKRDQWDIKLEWDPRDADKITGFYSDSQPSDGSVSVLPITFPAANKYPTHVGGANWVHVFSPALINEVHAGFTRVNWINSIPTDPTGQFGTTGDSIVGVPLPYPQSFDGFTAQSIGGNLSTLGNSANLQVLTDNQFYYDDDLTWQRGQHLFSIGAQALRYQENFYTAENYGFLGSFDYSGEFTSNPNVASEGTGFGGADFVLNRIDSAKLAENGGLNGTRQWRAAGFFEDDWRATPSLTLNFGIRYEFDQPWYEVHNREANVVLSGPNMGDIEYPGSVPAGAPAGSVVCSSRACYNPAYGQIMPRIGFAYELTPRFVVRGGYGATSDQEGNLALVGVPPFQLAFTKSALAPTTSNSGTPYTVQSGFTSTGGSAFQSVNAGFSALDPNIKPQYIQEYNLTTGYELNHTTSLSVGYVGETGAHLRNYRNANQLTTAGAVAPFTNLVGETGELFETMSGAMMNYNALQVTLRQQSVQGFSYTVNYTYAKAMTNSSGFYGTPSISGQNGAAQNGYNPGGDYGPSGQDIRHNLSAIGSYALPFGRGQRFAAHANRAVDAAIGGWQLSGSIIAYSGFPETITGPSENNVFSIGTSRANQYRKFAIHNRSVNHWWGTDPSAVPCTQPGLDNGTCAYGTAAVNTFGTDSVNSERAPGYQQVDASLFKDFHLTEAQFMTFRADFFNAGNITSYGAPANSVTSTTFGQITGVNSPARQIQLALKYNF
jgi:hypothetical protein